MRNIRHSLRFRLAITFAVFGALIGLLLSMGLSFAAHKLGERLMDETLSAEIEDFLSRRAHNPHALLPATISVRGFVHMRDNVSEDIPPGLLRLASGRYELTLDDVPYRVAVVDKNGERYFMLFNETQQRHREQQFLIYLIIGAVVTTLISAVIGWILAGRVVAPVAELARRVSAAKPEDEVHDVANGFADNEIGKLARVFDGYLTRMRSFIDRERAFTLDVSHELRTPLAIVQGVVELMEDDQTLDDRHQERVARVRRANREMTDITSALLLMAREKVLTEPAVKSCDVWKLVEDTVEAHRYLLNDKTLVELVCKSCPYIEAERVLLGIVVANLIRNAFAYTDSGKVTVLLDDNTLTVMDTGPGIAKEEIGKIFQRQYKGSGSTGSGIGLSLVKRICDQYGWRAIVESTVGQGTTARLIFSSPGAASLEGSSTNAEFRNAAQGALSAATEKTSAASFGGDVIFR
ncbi:MAG: HAMP domain-containing histidine kinase [Nitrosomonadales bacterium]|nr:HAMP domain-containing histidine kinase [Nitrosomonadales bacterium]